MATTVLPPPTDDAPLAEVQIDFPDNYLLIALCGEYDRNLAEIEQKLSVQILRRGNHLVVIGEKAAAEKRAEKAKPLMQHALSASNVLMTTRCWGPTRHP